MRVIPELSLACPVQSHTIFDITHTSGPIIRPKLTRTDGPNGEKESRKVHLTRFGGCVSRRINIGSRGRDKASCGETRPNDNTAFGLSLEFFSGLHCVHIFFLGSGHSAFSLSLEDFSGLHCPPPPPLFINIIMISIAIIIIYGSFFLFFFFLSFFLSFFSFLSLSLSFFHSFYCSCKLLD